MKWKNKSITNWIAKQSENLKIKSNENSSIRIDVISQNINRLYYIAFIAISVSIFNIIIFLSDTSMSSENGLKWMNGIIYSRVFIIVYMSFLLLTTHFLKKKSLVIMNLLIKITITTILLLGITITTIDQLITSSITPFLIVCIINAVVFIMKPYFAVIVYCSAYALYYYAIELTQQNYKILLSNRVSGLTAIGIGIGLSVVFWKSKVLYLKQQKYIEQQQLALEETNKRLTELNKMKDRLFSIITHDVREPMTTMISYMDLLEDNFHNNTLDNTKVIKAVKMQISYSYNMLDGLLDWCKHQSKGLTINLCHWQLYDIVYDMITMFKSKANDKKINLINNVNHDIYALIDRDLFELALRNIINNAIKFTKRDGTITISAFKNEERIIVKIQDTGIGINPNKLKHLFEETEKESSLGTEGEKGLGLGLQLSYEFIQRINGLIYAESIEGIGSAFYISVPCEHEVKI